MGSFNLDLKGVGRYFAETREELVSIGFTPEKALELTDENADIVIDAKLMVDNGDVRSINASCRKAARRIIIKVTNEHQQDDARRL